MRVLRVESGDDNSTSRMQVMRLESEVKAAQRAYETERGVGERACVLAEETSRLAEENKALRARLTEADHRARTAEGDAMNVRVWEQQAVALANQVRWTL